MLKGKIVIIVLFLFIVFCFLFIASGIYLPKDKDSSAEQIFVIERGQGVVEIAQGLEKGGLIRNNLYFIIYAVAQNESGHLQAGSYLLSPAMAVSEIVKEIVSGNIVKTEITIPEGFTIEQIMERLTEKELIQQTEPKNYLVKNYENGYNFLDDLSDDTSLEGFLFPDTYHFSYGTGEEKIIGEMLNNFDKKVDTGLREEIARQNKSLFEIIKMASLIEKEVRSYEDKQLVSGVLWSRLKYKVPLQVDATIIYITGKKSTRVSIAETKIESPYNTYLHRGLPIGPICNPGLESIKAAIYPQDSDYFYYLSAPDGTTIFSKTLEEHAAAKAKYL